MRIQLDFDEKGAKTVERLKEQTGLKTHKDLFNNALTLLDWAVSQRQKGRIVASMDEVEKNYKELQMPSLEYAAEHHQQNVASDREPATAH
jgi:hypothetical protein